MNNNIHKEFEVAIAGGGLAGLSAAIQLRDTGHSVVVIEKEKYPFHKLCGEYLSLEAVPHLKRLGFNIDSLNLPVIDTLFLSAPNGRSLTIELPLGGIGISRYLLDQSLANIARVKGASVLEEAKVTDIQFDNDYSIMISTPRVNDLTIKAKLCCAAYGKRSNIDVKWKRSFLEHHNKRLDNYIAVKYHVHSNHKKNIIELHNFENGYCGFSAIENNTSCLCYMTKAEDLKKSGNSIQRMEKDILHRNPHLKKIFTGSEIIKDFPITISQINFNRKSLIENNVIMLGDAAGMISPLCGNGMSIALHSSKIAVHFIDQFLNNALSRHQMEQLYVAEWKKNFSGRMRTGRILQSFFGSNQLSNLLVGTFSLFPFMAKPVVRRTHGKEF
ncbi:MAG: NAD(P)/FAD-dependent oxidoreductase [Flavisolibacter sp.]